MILLGDQASQRRENMTVKRLWQSFRLITIRSGYKRAEYIEKHHLFKHVGERTLICWGKMPLYPELISIGDNVLLGSRTSFITHDGTHAMLNRNKSLDLKKPLHERVGCIEIGDNVFVGAGTTILYDVKIGSNVIIAANSVVTSDLEPDGVYAGMPARRIKSMDDYIVKMQSLDTYPEDLRPKNQVVSQQLADFMWKSFHDRRNTE